MINNTSGMVWFYKDKVTIFNITVQCNYCVCTRVPCIVWLRDVQRAFISLILKLCKSLRSRCLPWTTGSL